MAFVYTDEHLSFLVLAFQQNTITEVTKLFNETFGFNKTKEAIYTCIKANKIKSGRTSGELLKGKSKLFTPEQVEFIKANYGPLSRKELHAALVKEFKLDIELKQLVSFVKNNKINSGRTGYFQKGVSSWSAGTKGVLKGNSGSFKKGQTPHNHVPVGSHRVNTDGYHETKIAEPNQWRGQHCLLWEKANGPIPDEHNVRFIDGNKNNVSLDNLILVNRAENHFLNKNDHARAPEELKETVLLVSKVQAKASSLKNSL